MLAVLQFIMDYSHMRVSKVTAMKQAHIAHVYDI